MSRIIVVADDDPDLRVELVDVDPAEGDWDGGCSRCLWTAHRERGFFPAKLEAVSMAEVHVDLPH